MEIFSRTLPEIIKQDTMNTTKMLETILKMIAL